MSPSTVAPSRRLEVQPPRFAGWIESFHDRHGPLSAEAGDETVTFTAADGSVAQCQVPFPPLRAEGSPDELARLIAAHAAAARTVGVFLVRLGGYAAGVFTGP